MDGGWNLDFQGIYIQLIRHHERLLESSHMIHGRICHQIVPVYQPLTTEAGKWAGANSTRNLMFSRWFKVTFLSPSWRSLNPLKGSLNHPKRVTLNHQVHDLFQELSFFFNAVVQYLITFFRKCRGNLIFREKISAFWKNRGHIVVDGQSTDAHKNEDLRFGKKYQWKKHAGKSRRPLKESSRCSYTLGPNTKRKYLNPQKHTIQTPFTSGSWLQD